jgi:hypothetical protein
VETTFAHPIEAELAALLDEHAIRWSYEPHRFRLDEGEFVPDFYLSDLGVYVECTVAGSRRSTRKNGKAREARERYGIIVNVLGRDDFERFAREYGLDSEALRVDVDHGGEPGAAHRGRTRREQTARARGNAPWLVRLRDQLRAVASAQTK